MEAPLDLETLEEAVRQCPKLQQVSLDDVPFGVSDRDEHDDEGRAGLFTEEQHKAYEDARTYKNLKNQLLPDSPELQAPISAL